MDCVLCTKSEVFDEITHPFNCHHPAHNWCFTQFAWERHGETECPECNRWKHPTIRKKRKKGKREKNPYRDSPPETLDGSGEVECDWRALLFIAIFFCACAALVSYGQERTYHILTATPLECDSDPSEMFAIHSISTHGAEITLCENIDGTIECATFDLSKYDYDIYGPSPDHPLG